MTIKHHLPIALTIAVLCACVKKDNPAPVHFTVSEDVSTAAWTGKATTHDHTGDFRVKGTLLADHKKGVTGGHFTIPIASIRNFDLPEDEKTELLNHLKSVDFFNMAVYPHATFSISGVEPYQGNDPNTFPGSNTRVTGKFTMLGRVRTISFPARIRQVVDTVYTEAIFKINRLDFDMASFNDPEETLYILPEVDISLHVKAVKK